MPHALDMMLSALEFDYINLFGLAVFLHFTRNFATFHIRRTDGNVFAICKQQHAVKYNLPARRLIQLLNLYLIALTDAILFAACGNYCVHLKTP